MDTNLSNQPGIQSDISEKTGLPKPLVNYFKSRFPIILGIFLILLVFTGGAYYLGLKKNNSNNNYSQTINSHPQAETTIAVQIEPSVNTQNQLIPSLNPTAIYITGSSSKMVSSPPEWQQFTATDPDFGIKTTLSLPPGFSFLFTGSEFTIQNASDASELWDYSSSVYRNNDGVLKNHYDGSSRRAWYEKRLAEKQSTDEIVGITEKSVNSSTYLEITVQTPAYDDHGVTSGTKIGKHFIFVQNNILHMITPVSNKAYTPSAQIPDNIGSIFASLTSVQIN
ncbi:hypothetical protein A3D78_04220 [Candidatus Gottesmanbacteria bacterium RIFCSPHIGHO2_02_FULL_39_14]|uniref:Uncharacterized protein n=1 Tax=Candidatus Gottesmanbacteria bacterium RIFCSPHIGHO2_02_FULL_39_14 TaxID=1798383 RepID=A0A1F5ZY71_9BACT|nr:MAG: hypothetical protein A3D78_04220 [Candidatus Gottesmanbacteria bacterium RIFCSPHIGHO2_02_FULL_39_14]